MPSALIWWRLHSISRQEKCALVQIHMLHMFGSLHVFLLKHNIITTNHCTKNKFQLLQEKLEVHLWYATLTHISKWCLSVWVYSNHTRLHFESNKTKTQLIISGWLYLKGALILYWQNLSLLHISKSPGIIIQLSFISFVLWCITAYLDIFTSQ